MFETVNDQFCKIPAADFLMGEGEDAHLIRLSAFEIGRFPVTCATYQLGVNADWVSPPRSWQNGRFHPMLADHPITFVSWHDAQQFCTWVNDQQSDYTYRLPTEAEWEFAARGPDGLPFPWGETFDKTKCANWENGIGSTSSINAFPENISPFGVRDMVGNVWEWTNSSYEPFPYSAHDGRETHDDPEVWRTLRGGSWLDTDWGVRSARRFGSPPHSRTNNTGFRLARNPKEVPKT